MLRDTHSLGLQLYAGRDGSVAPQLHPLTGAAGRLNHPGRRELGDAVGAQRADRGVLADRHALADSTVLGSGLIELNHKPLKMYETAFLAIVAIAWILYLAKSVRVRNTYWPELSQSNLIKGEAITSSS